MGPRDLSHGTFKDDPGMEGPARSPTLNDWGAPLPGWWPGERVSLALVLGGPNLQCWGTRPLGKGSSEGRTRVRVSPQEAGSPELSAVSVGEAGRGGSPGERDRGSKGFGAGGLRRSLAAHMALPVSCPE